MGSRLVKWALQGTYGEKPRMPAAEKLVLVCMALHALDSPGRAKGDPPRVYWGGHRLLARYVYGADNPGSMRLIRRAISNLEKRKLIRVYDGEPGYNRAYELLVGDRTNEPGVGRTNEP